MVFSLRVVAAAGEGRVVGAAAEDASGVGGRSAASDLVVHDSPCLGPHRLPEGDHGTSVLFFSLREGCLGLIGSQ
jgi:hypothetical protein